MPQQPPTLDDMKATAPRDTDTTFEDNVNARVIIEWCESGDEIGRIVPVVTIPKVGRLSIGVFETYLPVIYKAIHAAQSLKGRADEVAQWELDNAEA